MYVTYIHTLFFLHSPCLHTLFTALLSFSYQKSKPTVCLSSSHFFIQQSFFPLLCDRLPSPFLPHPCHDLSAPLFCSGVRGPEGGFS